MPSANKIIKDSKIYADVYSSMEQKNHNRTDNSKNIYWIKTAYLLRHIKLQTFSHNVETTLLLSKIISNLTVAWTAKKMPVIRLGKFGLRHSRNQEGTGRWKIVIFFPKSYSISTGKHSKTSFKSTLETMQQKESAVTVRSSPCFWRTFPGQTPIFCNEFCITWSHSFLKKFARRADVFPIHKDQRFYSAGDDI